MSVKSAPYQLSRTELARIASEEYVRNFWWFVAAVPAFGIACVIFASGVLQIVGYMAILWPFSIPARSVLSTAKSSRLFTNGCSVEATEGELVFVGEYNKTGTRLRYRVEMYRLKEVVERRGMLLIRSRIPGFLPVRAEAFESDADRERFVQLIQAGIAEVLGDTGSPQDSG